MFNRIRVILLLLVLIPSALAAAENTIAFGLTPVFLDNQVSFLQRWQKYLEERTGLAVRFVQRQTYREITQMVLSRELDGAWLCGYPYVQHRSELELLAIPHYYNQPLYRSYLIVHSDDQVTQTIENLKGKSFAYSDPDSNSGFLVPQAELVNRGFDPRAFFSRSFFTLAHRNVVRAVARGLADGGAVDGYVWDSLEAIDPQLTGKTRIVVKSELFGFPPIVTHRQMSERVRGLKRALLRMHEDEEGRQLLKELNLDAFGEADDSLYDSIAALARVVGDKVSAGEPELPF